MEHLDFRPVELPALWIRRLHDLMRHLGLVYGAIDLMRTADGDYVFLEINPAGEWLFVSERSGQPITEAMADHLIGLDHH
jgi:glutathione synthase/RimK-type ligase-like ATP-grasp enzyme